jgi:hypothetical protein
LCPSINSINSIAASIAAIFRIPASIFSTVPSWPSIYPCTVARWWLAVVRDQESNRLHRDWAAGHTQGQITLQDDHPANPRAVLLMELICASVPCARLNFLKYQREELHPL